MKISVKNNTKINGIEIIPRWIGGKTIKIEYDNYEFDVVNMRGERLFSFWVNVKNQKENVYVPAKELICLRYILENSEILNRDFTIKENNNIGRSFYTDILVVGDKELGCCFNCSLSFLRDLVDNLKEVA